MIKEIKENIWQLNFTSFGCCVYVLKLDNKNILIDTGSAENQKELLENLKELELIPEEINLVLLTHGHFDHIGNIDLFKNAEIYGSRKDFDSQRIKDLKEFENNKIKVIETPGHTRGSVCFYLQNQDILFSGDTIFDDGGIGRTDFPNSLPDEMENSLKKLKTFPYEILCPGHIN